MNFFDAFILGIVEGVTEFLPISSTAHLDISRLLLGLPASSFVKSFEIAIQLGAILAVVYLYREKIFSYIYLKKIIIAFIPTGVIGFILYKLIKDFLLGNTLVIAWAMLLGGIAILVFEGLYKESQGQESKLEIESLSVRELLVMGLAQSLAVIPGVSRSLAVILSGRLMGISKVLVTEFSFLLAVPTIFFATVYDLYKSGENFAQNEWGFLLLGFLVSFVTAIFFIKWLLHYIKNHSFALFGYYRVALAILIFALLIW